MSIRERMIQHILFLQRSIVIRANQLWQLAQKNYPGPSSTTPQCGSLRKLFEMNKLILSAMLGGIVGISIGINYYRLMELFVSSAFDTTATSSLVVKDYPNPSGLDILPPGIVEKETDLYLRRLWGNPAEDLPIKPNYLVTFTVGFDQRDIVNTMISKFSNNFTIVLFHYDGRTSEWEELEWSRKVIHISARKQTKWWFAKRFLHPDVVAPFDYIFIWDEDLGVEQFDAEAYIALVKKHGLKISQPALSPDQQITWQLTKRLAHSEMHKTTLENPNWCPDPLKPPCAGFVDLMAPVFSKSAWQCVWYMIQNDLVHGRGLDFAMGKCVEPAHENIGIVDAQWIEHKSIPTLGLQGEPSNGQPGWDGVQKRSAYEWELFKERLKEAEKVALGKHKN